jgi:preprotein translocase subunit SecG
METVLIVVHLMIVIALVAVILLQRSEGGALGIGGGSGGNFLSGRGQANVLTRTTTFLAIGFFATSIALTIVARVSDTPETLLERIEQNQSSTEPAIPETDSVLDVLGGNRDASNSPAPVTPDEPSEPQIPTAQ